MKKELDSLAFKAIYEQAPIGLGIVHPNKQFAYVNDAYANMLGYKKEELLGLTYEDVTHYDDLTEDTKQVERVAKGEINFYSMKKRYFKKDGSIIWVNLSVSAFINKGKFEAFIFSAVDISEEIRLSQELDEQKQLLEQIIDNIPAFIFLKSVDGTVLRANEFAAKAFGTTPEELEGQKISEYFNDEKQEAVVERMIAAGTPAYSNVHCIQSKDKRLWVSTTKIPIFDQDHHVKSVLAVSHDVTTIKEAELSVEFYKKRLEQAISIAKIGIWEWDASTNELTWNEEMHNIYGTNPLNQPIFNTWKHAIIEEDREEASRLVKKAMDNKSRFETSFRIFVNGKIKTIKATGEVINEPGKKKMIGSNLDITDLVEAQEQLAQSVEDLEQFAYIASHDLQEPLRTVSNYIQLFEMKYKDSTDPKIQKYLGFITEGNERMKKMIKDLLAFSRSGRSINITNNVNLKKVVDEVVNMMQEKISSTNAMISTRHLNYNVSYDEDKLVRVMLNLISNSIKFTQDGIPPVIQIYAMVHPHQFMVTVEDNGIGIDKDAHEKIFNMFETTNHGSGKDGSGIGLAVCKRIIEKHGGRIWVDSAPKKGSKFIFTIPREKHGTKQENISS